MNKEEILEKLISILGNPIGKGIEYSFSCFNDNCPSHQKNKKKLAINIETGNWHCWVCESSGKSINSLFRKTGNGNFYISKYQKENLDQFNNIKETISNIDNPDIIDKIGIVQIPNNFKPIITNQDIESDYFKQALIYLRKRDISYFDIIKYRIHYNIKDYQILVPSYDNNGDVLLYFIRNIFDSKKEYPKVERTKIIFNELFIDWRCPVILTEGIFDAFTAGKNSIPLLGSTLGTNHLLFKRLLNKKVPIYLALDPDAHDKMIKIAKLLSDHGLRVFIVKLVDGDINEIGREKFEKLLDGAYVYNDMDNIKNKLLNM